MSPQSCEGMVESVSTNNAREGNRIALGMKLPAVPLLRDGVS
jgi:hypothetical protein